MAQDSENTPDAQGGSAPLPRRRGRLPAFDAAALRVVETIAQEHPGASLNELIDLVGDVTGIRVTTQTMRKTLRALGFERIVPPKRSPTRPAPPPAAETAAQDPPRYGYGEQHRKQAPEALYFYGLSDGEWALVSDIFEDKVRGVDRVYSRRLMVDAMSYVVRGGVPWRMLPREFPPWHLVYKTFRRWAAQGRFEQMYDRLRGMWRVREGRSAEPTAAVIDSQSVKTSAQGGP